MIPETPDWCSLTIADALGNAKFFLLFPTRLQDASLGAYLQHSREGVTSAARSSPRNPEHLSSIMLLSSRPSDLPETRCTTRKMAEMTMKECLAIYL